jgi:NADP-dependent 3-hydroxy acid dehydrogenase YdfG
MKAVFPWMKERGGKIINFGSSLGQIGGEGTAAYNATKEAIRALSLGPESDDGVRQGHGQRVVYVVVNGGSVQT